MLDHITCLLRNLYAGQEATVRTGHGTTDCFQIRKGVCLLILDLDNQALLADFVLFYLFQLCICNHEFIHTTNYVSPNMVSKTISTFTKMLKIMTT